MDGLDLKSEYFGQLWKARRAESRSLDGQVTEHVATAGVVIVMVSCCLLLIVGTRKG